MATKHELEDVLNEKKINQIINPRLVQAPSDLTIEAAIQLMQEQRAGYIVIVEKRKCVGIFTETDVVRKIFNKDVD